MHNIRNRRNENNTKPDQGRPISRRGINRQRKWEATQNDDEQTVQNRECIDDQSEFAQAPSCKRELFAFDALEKDAADAEEVGRHDAESGERDEDCESDFGTDLDEREKSGADGHEVDCVEGHVPLLVPGTH